MPSAARQRLPADLWRQGHRKYTNSGSVFLNQEMQANPGQFDVALEEKQRPCSYRLTNKSHKKTHSGRGSPRDLPRGGSSDTLSILVLSDSDSNSGNGSSAISHSADSDNCLSSDLPRVSDAYAMESSIAPHPSQLPFPPLEWLQSSLLSSSPPVGSGISLAGLLRCHVAA